MAVMAGCPNMGMRADLVGGFAGVSVKNTFIDYHDDEPFFDDLMNHQLPIRQSSEPTRVFQRQSSATLAARPQFQRALDGVYEGSHENEEPECEPLQPQFSQQNWPASPGQGALAAEPQMYAAPMLAAAGPWCGSGTSAYSPTFEGQGAAACMQPQSATHDGVVGPAEWANTPTMMVSSLPNEYTQQGMSMEFNGSGHIAAAQPDGIEVPADWGNTTTVMVRNLPNKYTQGMMLTQFNESGFFGLYDFAYLPIDPDTKANRGYAFINFIDASSAWKFKTAYEGRKMPHYNSNKFVSVTPATLQGFEANYEHYSSARVSRGDPSARPLFLREPSHPIASRGSGNRSKRGKKSAVDRAAKERGEGSPVGQVISQMTQTAREATVRTGQTSVASNAMTIVQSAATLTNDMSAKKNSQRKPAPAFAPRADAEPAPLRSIMYCPFCGGQCAPGFRYCQFCGANLQACLGPH